jgi:hypothetical protein
MFTKITYFKKGWGDESNHAITKHGDFESAKTAGMQESCLNIVISVYIRDAESKLLASWNKLDNYWIDYKDAKGKFITPNNYFSKSRKRTEKFALEEGFNIRIIKKGATWKVYAADRVIPIEPSMLPWVSEAVEETQVLSWRKEDDGDPGFTEAELLSSFADYLTKRIRTALDNNPENWSFLRRCHIYK